MRNQLSQILQGELTWTSFKAWIGLIFVFLYIISPIDIIPDFMAFPISLIDDVIAAIWLYFFLKSIIQEQNARRQ